MKLLPSHDDVAMICIGASAGGVNALLELLSAIPAPSGAAFACVVHVPERSSFLLPELLQARCALPVSEAQSTQPIEAGRICFAPPGYHLSVEPGGWYSLSNEDPVQFARPSIDVLFESAAAAYGRRLLAVLLTGANEDGARGLECVQRHGGLTVVQAPEDAEFPQMPSAALARMRPSAVLRLSEIRDFLVGLSRLTALSKRGARDELRRQ
jgi:two-component system chemotaxis response regulator CheB